MHFTSLGNMIGGQDIWKGKEWFVKLKQVEVYLPERQISLLAFSKIQTEILLERKRQENEVTCPVSSLLMERSSKEEAKERWAVRTRMCAASENEDSRSGDSFEWVILLVLSLIWVYSIKRMRGVCVQACVYALVRAGLYKCIIFLRIFLMVSTS